MSGLCLEMSWPWELDGHGKENRLFKTNLEKNNENVFIFPWDLIVRRQDIVYSHAAFD